MPANALSKAKPLAAPAAPVRTIARSDLGAALREGLHDFWAMRGDLLFAGLLYPLIGIVAATVTLGGALLPLFFPIAAGIALMGPVAAIGFYELARRREAGLESGWSHFLDARRRPAADQLWSVSALLFAIFAIWIVIAGALYVALWGPSAPESLGAFLTRLFTTTEGWALIVAGNLIGFVFAVLVLTVSVVSLPMLVDRDVSASEAVETSVAAVRANKAVMLRWGAIVAAMLVLGSIPAFIGLAFVLPWLGYATWHLYTRLVDRDAIGRNGR